MAQRERDPRLNRRRQEDCYFEHQITTDRGRCIRGRSLRTTASGHPGPAVAPRLSAIEVDDGNRSAGRKAEQYDYEHKRNRSRSPFAITDSPSNYSKKQHCETDSLLQNESIQITVENDKFKSPFSSRLWLKEDTFSQNPLPAVSRASTHDQHDIAEETPCITRAREMTMRTREMLSKLTGWTPLSLQPLSSDHLNMTDRPSFVNVSNSAYTKVSASSEVAQSILRNISAVAAAFCPKESGGVAHIKYKTLGKRRKSTTEDNEERYLYGEELVPEKIENALSGLPGDDESQRKCQKSAAGDQSLNWAESSIRKTTDSECDPVVANVLKSIGFNFELSKIMQEKAKEEHEENVKNRVLSQKASSFHTKQLAMKSCNAQEISNEFLMTRHLSVDLNETLKRKDGHILYDDFSNSEDEFSGTEKKKWTASGAEPELSVGTGRQNVQMARSLPSGMSFPSVVSSPVSLLATPSPGHSLTVAVQPPPPSVVIPLQPAPLLLPPPLLQGNIQPVPHQQPLWPAYQIPLPTGVLPKWKPTVSQAANEVEWEQSTQEFLRKLQEPRTTELPQNREARMSRSRSPSSSSTSNERVKKQRRKKRSASRDLSSRSDEQNTKKRHSDKVTISDQKESYDQVTREKRLSVLKGKLNCMKKEHSQLMSIRQKSAHTKEKLKLNRRRQDELNADILDLLHEINCRSNEGHSAFASNEERVLGQTQQREIKVMNTQMRYPRRNSTKRSRGRDQKNDPFMHRELSVENKEWSSKFITDRKTRQIDGSPQQELKLSAESPLENKLVNVEVKPEENTQVTEELESKKERAVKKRVNNDRKTYENSLANEPKQETKNIDDEKSLDNKKDLHSNDELQESKIRYDYYDGGDNWCSICKSLFSKLSEFLDHLHCTEHQQAVTSSQTSLAKKPWALQQVPQSKPHNKLPPICETAAGMEFLIPIKGFFCTLCQQFSGDCDDAELHVLSEKHNAKFKQQCSDNPTYQKGYYTVKMEKMAIKKLDKEKILVEGLVVEKTLKSCIKDSGNNSPVARHAMHMGRKLRTSFSEKTASHSAKPLKNVPTQKPLQIKNDLELNLNVVEANLLNEANKRFANLTKEAAETVLEFSDKTICNLLVSKRSDQVDAYLETQNLHSCEIKNVDANEKTASKKEPVLQASLQEEADVRAEESLNAGKDTVKNINNKDHTTKPADAAATEQTNLDIHLLQEPISKDSSEVAENKLLKNQKMQGTVCMMHPLVSRDIADDFTDLNAKCNAFAPLRVMSKTFPNAVSEIQGVMLQSGSNTRNTNACELAVDEVRMAQSHVTYLLQEPSSIEVAESEESAFCQSQKPSSIEVDEKEDPAIHKSQKPSSVEADERL